MSRSCWPAIVQVVALLSSTAGVGAKVPAAETRKEVSIWSLEAMDVDLRKYEIEGPFAIGDPVHETLTLKALVRGGAVLGTADRKSAQVAQFMRGVFWNDDPCAQLFTESISNPLRPSRGLVWYFDFRLARSETLGNFSKLDCPLLGESHFGRLQFLHGMANGDDIAAEVTQEEVMAWISVTYRIATGRLDARQPLSADPVAAKLLGDFAALSATRLFRDATPAETRQRALGSLLHLVQDSFARGHVEREDSGAIVQFLSYRNQNSNKHAHDDAWRKGETEEARILATPGAAEAIDSCAKIVALYVKNAPWSEVENHLRQGPFLLGSPTHPSGPGKFK